MHSFETPLKKWKYALKLDSWPKLLIPAILGQALGYYASGSFHGSGFLLGIGFTVCDVIFIVLLNDWADQRVDRIKRMLFPLQCSPKTIPDHILPAHKLYWMGLWGGFFALAITLIGFTIQRPWLPAIAALALCLFQSYSFRPLKLNYRGGGEFMEGFGLGFCLPWLNAYAQSGLLWHPIYAIFFGCCALSFASALASGLADEESDLTGGKRTFTTIFGNRKVRRLTEYMVFSSPLIWFLCDTKGTPDLLKIVFVPSIPICFYGMKMRRISDLAKTRAFASQRIYKKHLHQAIWIGMGTLAFVLFIIR